ncbi:cation:proton antiporter [soil metagenome]
MDYLNAIEPFSQYSIWLIVFGFAILLLTTLPRYLTKYPFSLPIALLLMGFVIVFLPFGITFINPIHYPKLTEHITEMGVIISLMGAGLKIDRPIGWKRWGSTWRLLGITMVLSIAFATFIGWWVAAFAPVTALLLGAVIAPTDPVLASEVQVGQPGKGSTKKELDEQDDESIDEDEVRFSLTSEAGFNDALAFPFTNLAIALALAGATMYPWWHSWLLIDVLYKLLVGGLIGWGVGKLLGRILLSMPAKSSLAKSMQGLSALSGTLLLYGITELIGGYGFLAVFIGALTIRNHERDHEYHEYLHLFAQKSEQLLMAVVLLGLGGAIAGGLLQPLTWPLVLAAVLIIVVVRPLAGVIGFVGFKQIPWRDKLAISFFGIRGIGSLYYLAYALNQHYFPQAEALWALVALVIVISIFVHGTTATPVMNWLDKKRE